MLLRSIRRDDFLDLEESGVDVGEVGEEVGVEREGVFLSFDDFDLDGLGEIHRGGGFDVEDCLQRDGDLVKG